MGLVGHPSLWAPGPAQPCLAGPHLHPRRPQPLSTPLPRGHQCPPPSLSSGGSQGESPVTGRRQTPPLFLKGVKEGDPGNHQPGSLTSALGQSMEQILLEALSRHTGGREVTGDSQHSFTRGKSCLTSLVAFCDGGAVLADKGGAADASCLDCCKAFGMVSHNILVTKLVGPGFAGWTVQRIRDRLDGRVQRVAVNERLSVQMAISNQRCPSGGRVGTGAVQCL